MPADYPFVCPLDGELLEDTVEHGYHIWRHHPPAFVEPLDAPLTT